MTGNNRHAALAPPTFPLTDTQGSLIPRRSAP